MELYDFQKIGATFLAGKRLALLADEMGLGKTPQAIAACDLIGAKRVLVICPAVARINWRREFEKFGKTPREIKVIETKKDEWLPGQTLIVSFNMATDLGPDLMGPEAYDALIIDESHLVKSPTARRSAAILGAKGIIRFCKRTWMLSGTPSPNGYASEVWLMLYTFGVTWRKYDSFVSHFCSGYMHQGRFNVTGTKPERIPELRSLIESIMLRRKKVDVLPELPEITFQDIVVPKGQVDIDEEASFAHYVFPVDRRAELVDKLEKEESSIKDVLDRLGESERAMQALEALATSVATLRRYRGLQKVEAVADLLKQDLQNNAYDKVVVFAIHQGVIENLRFALAEFGAVTLYGKTPPDKRQTHIDKFQNDEKTRVFIANIAAAGPSITLTRAHHIVFVEQDWTPGNNAQAAMRCHRIGQKNAVTVRTILLDDPIDERVSAALKRKTKQLLETYD